MTPWFWVLIIAAQVVSWLCTRAIVAHYKAVAVELERQLRARDLRP